MITEAEFESIYQSHKNMVYNLCLHYVQNTTEAQDITQESFIKIFNRYDQYDATKGTIKSWISGITVHQCLDYLKSKKTKKRFGLILSLFQSSSYESVHQLSDFDHPGVILENKTEVEHLFMLIRTLPDHQKTALILNKIEDRPVKEVAEIMNITSKAVESLLQRAKQNLSKKISLSEG
ncbi:MAG: RNA polymerase sigma factor [Saprospiraceae bacterium]